MSKKPAKTAGRKRDPKTMFGTPERAEKMRELSEPSAHTVKRAKQAAFLAAFAECGSITKACKAAHCVRREFYDWKGNEEEFAKQFRALDDQVLGLLEDEAMRRAVEGLPRMKFCEGRTIHVKDENGAEVPYIEYEFSDRLIELLLKARAPHKYRERLDMKVDGEVTMKVIERPLTKAKA